MRWLIDLSFRAAGAAGFLFFVYKIAGLAPVASWSWIWVLAPFWGYVVFLGACVLAGVLSVAFLSPEERRARLLSAIEAVEEEEEEGD